MSANYQEVLQVATRLYHQSPDWVTFFREVLGIKGVVRRAFPEVEAMVEFEKSEAFEEIQQMVGQLRERSDVPPANQEPTRVITVRLPKCLHESLRKEAHDRHTSMNKLCISKLLKIVDGEQKETGGIPQDRLNVDPVRETPIASETGVS